MDERPPTRRPSGGRLASLSIVGALTVAAVGFFTGTSAEGPARVGYQPVGAARPAATAPAPAQSDLRTIRWGTNAPVYTDAVPTLTRPVPLPVGPSQPRTDPLREAALRQRADRRAYEGAPPTIPHAIDQTQAPNCLVCHERGMQVAGKTAPVMSHRRFESCIQCHVPAVSPFPLQEEPVAGNAFLGMARAGRGERAWPGAPPVMPHPTLMREDCGSCHGTRGAFGLRTPHPERGSCVQCHAPSALLDQRLPRPGLERMDP